MMTKISNGSDGSIDYFLFKGVKDVQDSVNSSSSHVK